MLLQRLLPLLSVSVLVGPLLVGKCAGIIYSVSGRVLDPSGRPIPGATITITVDGAPPVPTEPQRLQGPPITSTEDGGFGSTFYFDPVVSYSACTGHDCSGRPRNIRLVVVAPGYKPLEFTSALPKQGPLGIRVPDLRLLSAS